MPAKGTTTIPGKLVRRVVRTPGRRLNQGQTLKAIQAAERRAQALELRKAGATYQEIANALGYKGVSGAEAAVKRGIDLLGMEAAKDVVLIDLARLDDFQKRCTAEMRKGDLSQIDRIMRIMTMRHNLLGITAESYREAVAKQAGVSVTQNNVMVIQGSEVEFVKGMMRTVGVDPDSPEAKKRLKALEAGTPSPPLPNPADQELRTVDSLPRNDSPAAPGYKDEIIEAEIVDA